MRRRFRGRQNRVREHRNAFAGRNGIRNFIAWTNVFLVAGFVSREAETDGRLSM